MFSITFEDPEKSARASGKVWLRQGQRKRVLEGGWLRCGVETVVDRGVPRLKRRVPSLRGRQGGGEENVAL